MDDRSMNPRFYEGFGPTEPSLKYYGTPETRRLTGKTNISLWYRKKTGLLDSKISKHL